MASTGPPSPEDRISQVTVTKAVKALLKWRKLHARTTHQKPAAEGEEKQEFLEDEDGNGEEGFIYLLLTLMKIPPNLSKIPRKISLPNPLHSLADNNLRLCLVIDDRPIKSPYRITAEFAQKKVKSEDIPIDKVVKLSKLKSDCKTLEGRRKLYESYDMFLTDKRVVSLLPGVLGKQFYKKKRKLPVPLDLRSRDGWKEQIERAVNSAFFCFGSGSCSVVKVGKCEGMSSDEIVENVFAAVKGIAEVVPKKWGGIRALHLKLSDSLALPVYDGNSGLLNAADGVGEGGLEGKKNGILELKKMKEGREGTLKR